MNTVGRTLRLFLRYKDNNNPLEDFVLREFTNVLEVDWESNFVVIKHFDNTVFAIHRDFVHSIQSEVVVK